MHSTTHPTGMQLPTSSTTSGGEDRQHAYRRYRVGTVCWSGGLIMFIISCLVIHTHPAPYTLELATTHFIQNFRPWPWFWAVADFPSTLNNPYSSAIALGCWSGFMGLMALVFWLRKLNPLTWLQSAIFLLLTVMSSAGLNVIIDELVARPRPDPHKYHTQLYTPLVPFPTYPSGHVEHDVAFYGFLLYLSFLRPVWEWRYRWFLLPLQLYAVFDILMIGYSRILEGDHWLADVMGGYLEGAVYLFFFIFLYRWTISMVAKYRAKKLSVSA